MWTVRALLAMTALTYSGGCALVDGLTGNDGGAAGGLCTPGESYRALTSELPGTILSVTLSFELSHTAPSDLSLEIRAPDFTSRQLSGLVSGFNQWPDDGTFAGVARDGTWAIVITDSAIYDAGAWSEVYLELCDDVGSCDTLVDAELYEILDCE